MSNSITHLIPVGFYCELRGGRPHEPRLRAAVQSSASPNEVRIIQYLNSGELMIATAGVVSDVLEPKFGIIGPPHILTDGTYAWPAIFAHYVERHHVRPPEEFVSHMIANAWTVPTRIDVLSLKLDRNAPQAPQ
jgi:hypothetical protein